jgi:RNA polymerase sigma factor (sigma-70 family)
MINHATSEYLPTRKTLLSRLKDLGDQKSWQEFFDIYWKLIYNAAIKSGLSHSDAEDVVQETVVTVAREMPEFNYDPKRSFKAWLLKITRCRIVDQVKRVQPKEISLAHHPRDDEIGDTATEERIADPASLDLESFWESQWEQHLMTAAIDRVKARASPKQFQMFELYVLKDWPIRKVMETLRVSMTRVHVAKHRVASLIKKEVERLQKGRFETL